MYIQLCQYLNVGIYRKRESKCVREIGLDVHTIVPLKEDLFLFTVSRVPI